MRTPVVNKLAIIGDRVKVYANTGIEVFSLSRLTIATLTEKLQRTMPQLGKIFAECSAGTNKEISISSFARVWIDTPRGLQVLQEWKFGSQKLSQGVIERVLSESGTPESMQFMKAFLDSEEQFWGEVGRQYESRLIPVPKSLSGNLLPLLQSRAIVTFTYYGSEVILPTGFIR